MMGDYDVLVAGGGPAGLSAARSAASEGMEVLLLELQAQIGQTGTSAWVAGGISEEGFPQAVKAQIERVNLHSVHQELGIEGSFGKIIDRNRLDKFLASEAAEEGVDIWVGSPVKDLLEGKKGIKGVRTEAGEWSEEVEGEVILDASGARAEWSSIFLRKVLNSDWDKEKTTQTNEYLMANVPRKKEVDLYFTSMLAPMGHAWIHPFGDEFSMAGIRGVRIHPDSALDEFIGREEPDELGEGVPVGAYRGQLPIEGSLENSVAAGIMAVGSAAGQIYPFSGHGLKYALEAGKIAGEIAARGIREDDTSEERLAEYDRLWRDKFEKEISAGKMLHDALSTSPDQKMDAILEALKGNPELQKNFVKVFLGEDLEESLQGLFKDEECVRVFGKEKVNRILSLYS